jgi:hypothetical protein
VIKLRDIVLSGQPKPDKPKLNTTAQLFGIPTQALVFEGEGLGALFKRAGFITNYNKNFDKMSEARLWKQNYSDAKSWNLNNII